MSNSTLARSAEKIECNDSYERCSQSGIQQFSFSSTDVSSFDFSCGEMSFENSLHSEQGLRRKRAISDIVQRYVGDFIDVSEINNLFLSEDSSDCGSSSGSATSTIAILSQIEEESIQYDKRRSRSGSRESLRSSSDSRSTVTSLNDESTRMSPRAPRIFQPDSGPVDTILIDNLLRKTGLADVDPLSEPVFKPDGVERHGRNRPPRTPGKLWSNSLRRVKNLYGDPPAEKSTSSHRVIDGQQNHSKTKKARDIASTSKKESGKHRHKSSTRGDSTPLYSGGHLMKNKPSYRGDPVSDCAVQLKAAVGGPHRSRRQQQNQGHALLHSKSRFESTDDKRKDAPVSKFPRKLLEVESRQCSDEDDQDCVEPRDSSGIPFRRPPPLPHGSQSLGGMSDPVNLELALERKLARIDQKIGLLSGVTQPEASPRRMLSSDKDDLSGLKISLARLLTELFIKEEMLERMQEDRRKGKSPRQSRGWTKLVDGRVQQTERNLKGTEEKLLGNSGAAASREENEIVFEEDDSAEKPEAVRVEKLWDNQNLWEVWAPVVSPKAIELVETVYPGAERLEFAGEPESNMRSTSDRNENVDVSPETEQDKKQMPATNEVSSLAPDTNAGKKSFKKNNVSSLKLLETDKKCANERVSEILQTVQTPANCLRQNSLARNKSLKQPSTSSSKEEHHVRVGEILYSVLCTPKAIKHGSSSTPDHKFKGEAPNDRGRISPVFAASPTVAAADTGIRLAGSSVRSMKDKTLNTGSREDNFCEDTAGLKLINTKTICSEGLTHELTSQPSTAATNINQNATPSPCLEMEVTGDIVTKKSEIRSPVEANSAEIARTGSAIQTYDGSKTAYGAKLDDVRDESNVKIIYDDYLEECEVRESSFNVSSAGLGKNLNIKNHTLSQQKEPCIVASISKASYVRLAHGSRSHCDTVPVYQKGPRPQKDSALRKSKSLSVVHVPSSDERGVNLGSRDKDSQTKTDPKLKSTKQGSLDLRSPETARTTPISLKKKVRSFWTSASKPCDDDHTVSTQTKKLRRLRALKVLTSTKKQPFDRKQKVQSVSDKPSNTQKDAIQRKVVILPASSQKPCNVGKQENGELGIEFAKQLHAPWSIQENNSILESSGDKKNSGVIGRHSSFSDPFEAQPQSLLSPANNLHRFLDFNFCRPVDFFKIDQEPKSSVITSIFDCSKDAPSNTFGNVMNSVDVRMHNRGSPRASIRVRKSTPVVSTVSAGMKQDDGTSIPPDMIKKSWTQKSSLKSSFKKIFKTGKSMRHLQQRELPDGSVRSVVFKEDLIDDEGLQTKESAEQSIPTRTSSEYRPTSSILRKGGSRRTAEERSFECLIGSDPFEAESEGSLVAKGGTGTRNEKIFRALKAYVAMRTPTRTDSSHRSAASKPLSSGTVVTGTKIDSPNPAIMRSGTNTSSTIDAATLGDSSLTSSAVITLPSRTSFACKSCNTADTSKLSAQERVLSQRLAEDLKILSKIERKRRKLGSAIADSKMEEVERSLEVLKSIKKSMRNRDDKSTQQGSIVSTEISIS